MLSLPFYWLVENCLSAKHTAAFTFWGHECKSEEEWEGCSYLNVRLFCQRCGSQVLGTTSILPAILSPAGEEHLLSSSATNITTWTNQNRRKDYRDAEATRKKLQIVGIKKDLAYVREIWTLWVKRFYAFMIWSKFVEFAKISSKYSATSTTPRTRNQHSLLRFTTSNLPYTWQWKPDIYFMSITYLWALNGLCRTQHDITWLFIIAISFPEIIEIPANCPVAISLPWWVSEVRNVGTSADRPQCLEKAQGCGKWGMCTVLTRVQKLT